MRSILLFVILSTISFGVTSQASFELGAVGGVNLTNVYKHQVVVSSHYGMYSELKFSELGLESDLLFSNQYPYDDSGGTWNTRYFNVPLLVNWHWSSGLYFQVGAQLGVLLDDQMIGLTDRDFASLIGIGWESTFGVRINLRSVRGLTDVSGTSFFEPHKNRFAQLSIGYRLLKSEK